MQAPSQGILRAILRFLKLAVVQPSARLVLLCRPWLHRRHGIWRYLSKDICLAGRTKDHILESNGTSKSNNAQYTPRCSEHALQSCPTQPSQDPHFGSIAESRAPALHSFPANEQHPLRELSTPTTTPSILVQSPDRAGSSYQPSPSLTDVSEGAEHQGFEHSDPEMLLLPEDQGLDSVSSLTHVEDAVNLKLKNLHEGFRPLVPESISRYDRDDTAEETEGGFSIEAFKTTFLDKLRTPGWSTYTHPEGTRVFYHKTQRIFTEVNLFNDEILQGIEFYAATLYDYLETINKRLDPDTDIVFELMLWPEDETLEQGKTLSKYICNYYLVKHSTRVVFWLDDSDAKAFPIWSEVSGVNSSLHVHHIVEASYWYHCSLYPTSRPWSVDDVDEMRDILVHAIIDSMTSASSTAPYTVSDLQQMLGVMNTMRKPAKARLGAMSSLSRIMSFFMQQRYYNFHGQPCARLDRDKSVYGTAVIRHSPLLFIISPFLFSAPDVHLRSLQKIWVDRILHQTAYTALITKLTDEWKDFIITATVLLNANVAFLAIQSVDDEIELPERSSAQLASYVSVLTSMGSIILGLLLVRQNRTKSKESATEATEYLAQRHHPRLGLETLAILWSLPYALLMWAMLSFLASFFFLIFQNTSNDIRTGLATVSSVIAVMIMWCIITSWEIRPDERNFVRNIWDKVSALKTRITFVSSASVSIEPGSEESRIVEGSGMSARMKRWGTFIGSFGSGIWRSILSRNCLDERASVVVNASVC